MDITLLDNEINYWNNIFQTKKEDIFFELSFFKIFVQFEQFMISSFIHYATGNKSNKNYIPDRKLKFNSLPHLEGVLVIESKRYLIEKPESIEQLSKHIFKDDDNPFEKIFNDSIFSDNIVNMRIIRNYIAHGGDESLKKYKKTICNNQQFIKPFEYLLKKKKNSSQTNYDLFISLIQTHCHIIFDYKK